MKRVSLSGKRDDFVRADFYSLERLSPLFSRSFINSVIDEIIEKVACWERLATEAQVPRVLIDEVAQNLRLGI